jgi:hypothetical protein
VQVLLERHQGICLNLDGGFGVLHVGHIVDRPFRVGCRSTTPLLAGQDDPFIPIILPRGEPLVICLKSRFVACLQFKVCLCQILLGNAVGELSRFSMALLSLSE